MFTVYSYLVVHSDRSTTTLELFYILHRRLGYYTMFKSPVSVFLQLLLIFLQINPRVCYQTELVRLVWVIIKKGKKKKYLNKQKSWRYNWENWRYGCCGCRITIFHLFSADEISTQHPHSEPRRADMYPYRSCSSFSSIGIWLGNPIGRVDKRLSGVQVRDSPKDFTTVYKVLQIHWFCRH